MSLAKEFIKHYSEWLKSCNDLEDHDLDEEKTLVFEFLAVNSYQDPIDCFLYQTTIITLNDDGIQICFYEPNLTFKRSIATYKNKTWTWSY